MATVQPERPVSMATLHSAALS